MRAQSWEVGEIKKQKGGEDGACTLSGGPSPAVSGISDEHLPVGPATLWL